MESPILNRGINMLTGKKSIYAAARTAGHNQKQAAIMAGYSEATASQAASRLEKDPDVKSYIARKTPKKPPQPELEKTPAKPPKPEVKREELQVSSVYRKHTDPMDFLTDLMNDSSEDSRLRSDAAKALLPYVHQKKGEEGKKEAKEREAKETGAGKFALGPRPANVRPIK